MKLPEFKVADARTAYATLDSPDASREAKEAALGQVLDFCNLGPAVMPWSEVRDFWAPVSRYGQPDPRLSEEERDLLLRAEIEDRCMRYASMLCFKTERAWRFLLDTAKRAAAGDDSARQWLKGNCGGWLLKSDVRAALALDADERWTIFVAATVQAGGGCQLSQAWLDENRSTWLPQPQEEPA